ncbi:unnamed protein product [Fraxinus pennsylvanica]|uniref:Translation elongation factor EFG/EF2 domain-containing protein n=1 Tax=Fraxinus pennsylvanica TaxID=56036 RepID=A0AAD1ZW87_9LAMI|nr:unnamed protein product [Fraxinus pennsylvanica]
MENYQEGFEPDEATVKKLIRLSTISSSFVPILRGSAFKNKGVQPLLDVAGDYFPSPIDLPAIKGTNPDDPDFPDPVIKGAIEPKTKADVDKTSAGLVKLAQEDLSFHFSQDEEINETVDANVGAPKVNYRESISRVSEVKNVHQKQSGGSGQFADVTIRFDRMEAGGGYEFKNVRAVLVDGSYHEVNSSVLAFQLAARGAFWDGMRKINSFGDKPGGLKVVDAMVPLAEMFQYVSTLRGMTKGRASCTMQLAKFDVVPQHIQNQLARRGCCCCVIFPCFEVKNSKK